jgi:hypothetical protein
MISKTIDRKHHNSYTSSMNRILQLRKRRGNLPAIALALLAFLGLVTVVLGFQLYGIFTEPGGLDLALLLLLVITLLIFVIMGLGVFWLDFNQDLVLLRSGILVVPPVFKSYLIAWDDIQKLEIREGNGFRSIEYRLRPGSAGYEARFGGKKGGKQLISLESRSGGFHGAIPAQSYKGLDVNVKQHHVEQYKLRVNKLYPILYRYWTKPETRLELLEVEPTGKPE